MKKQFYFFVAFAFLTAISPSFAQNAGDLFTAFGTNGKVNTNIGQADFLVTSQAIQSDGKIIIAGNVDNTSTSMGYLLRLNADGTVDTSFNTTGKIIFSEIENMVKVLVQSDGKIVVGGSFNLDVVLMRFNSNGTIDTGFGTNGIISNTSNSSSRSMQDFAIQTDGKLVVLSDFDSGSQDFRVLRYNTNGSFDSNFGNNGSLTTDIGNTEFPQTILIQSDGKIVVGGTTLNQSNSQFSVFIARYNSSGTSDNSFNSTGKKIFSYTGFSELYNLDLQSDGKIAFVFSSYISSVPKLNIVRINTSGSSDVGFGSSGIATLTAPNYFGNGLKKFKIQDDGRFFILSSTYQMVNNSSNNNLLLIRLNANATFDTTFNNTGFQEFSFFANDDLPGDFSFLGNQILVSGNTEETLVLNKIGLAKFNENGSLNPSFDTDGKATYLFPFSAYDESKCSVMQSDGKFILAGISHTDQNSVLSACRYNADGSIDTSFGENGFFKFNTRIYDGINTIKIDSNGKVLLGLENSATVIRLNSNGTIDNTFGTGGFAIITTTFSSVSNLKVLADNSILVAGQLVSSINNVSSFNFMLAKLNPNGTLNTSFGSNGITTLNSTANFDKLHQVDTQADGKIIAVGTFLSDGNNVDNVIFRTNSNGILDPTFNGSGTFTIGIPNASDLPIGLQIQNDGKILVASNYEDSSKSYLFRITTAGLIDTTFDLDGVIYFNTNLINGIGAIKVLPNQQILVAGDKENATLDFTLLKYNANGSLDTSFGTNGKVTTDFYNDLDVASGLLISNDNNIIVTGSTLSPTGYADFAAAKYYLLDGLGISDVRLNKKVLFYPNPVQNILHLSPDVETVTIFNLEGKEIKVKLTNNSLTTENLPKGIYIIQMKLSNDELISEKLIKD